MSVINNIIPESNFEKVRDQLAAIIADELAGQYALTDDEDFNVNVYTERYTLPQSDEGKVIIIGIDRIRFDNHKQTAFDCSVTYNIDFYSFSKSDSSDNGYYLSASLAHKLAGVVSKIIQNPRYLRIGFSDKSIVSNRSISDMLFDHPNDARDATHPYMCRMQIDVRVSEPVNYTPDSINIESINTTVEIANTDKGYLFIVNT